MRDRDIREQEIREQEIREKETRELEIREKETRELEIREQTRMAKLRERGFLQFRHANSEPIMYYINDEQCDNIIKSIRKKIGMLHRLSRSTVAKKNFVCEDCYFVHKVSVQT